MGTVVLPSNNEWEEEHTIWNPFGAIFDTDENNINLNKVR